MSRHPDESGCWHERIDARPPCPIYQLQAIGTDFLGMSCVCSVVSPESSLAKLETVTSRSQPTKAYARVELFPRTGTPLIFHEYALIFPSGSTHCDPISTPEVEPSLLVDEETLNGSHEGGWFATAVKSSLRSTTLPKLLVALTVMVWRPGVVTLMGLMVDPWL